jgi:triosephosphate isomerase
VRYFSLRKAIIAGNWKMYKITPEAKALVEDLKTRVGTLSDREVVVCPPYTSLAIVAEVLQGSAIKMGAQNMYWEDKGAFTGEIAPGMLKDAGCVYVIIGHSERRQYFGETDGTVNKKMKKAFQSGLLPIVCIGETLAEREGDKTFQVLERQVREGMSGLSQEEAKKLVVAYEPVWAIGTGKTATSQQAEEAHKFIRQKLGEIYSPAIAEEIRILYGGSVKPDNCKELMGLANIDGALVGGASLEAESFSKIINY